MTIIDTTIMIALLKGAPEIVKRINEVLDENSSIVVTAITVYELLKGASLSARGEENLLNVKKAISNFQILDLTTEASAEAARIYCELRKAGKLRDEYDVLIAAIAITNGEPVLTYDQHFKVIAGLRLI